MPTWFDAAEDLSRQLVCAFVDSDGCERAVLDMLLNVRSTSIAAKVPTAIRAIRINFDDARSVFFGKEESQRGIEWQRKCVILHIQAWTDVMPQLSLVWIYKLNNLYPNLPESWRRSLLFTEEATFSVTPFSASQLLCDKIIGRGGSPNGTIVDAFACVGGDSANFTRRFRLVHSIELDPVKVMLLRHNLRICLNCPYLSTEMVEPPSEMLPLPEHLRVHCGDCRVVIPALQLVSRFCFRQLSQCLT
jgi:hypothetical protein